MWRLYKPRAGHTSETAVNVSSVAFWRQEHGTSCSQMTLSQFNYTISEVYTSSLSVLEPLPRPLSPPSHSYYTSPLLPGPILFISRSRKWWWVANLTWFSLTLTSRVAGPAATSGPNLKFSQGGWEMVLVGLVGLGAQTLPHVLGSEEGWGRTPTNRNMKALQKYANLVRAPSYRLRNRSK